MASPNNPVSSAELIRKYSQARVVTTGRFTGYGLRPLTASDVREAMIRQYK